MMISCKIIDEKRNPNHGSYALYHSKVVIYLKAETNIKLEHEFWKMVDEFGNITTGY